MSSEGSVTSSESRIRQFGLYRTIDARTEEFLRSSRKRQIRQGCACAAISTAITVTVVVSVILVYEYSINSESNANKKISLKSNWFGLMNESEITSLDSKFNKKINFDRTTLKLLPILLKALNQNRYLEKILEDYSSSSPPYVGKDSTETTFKRNVFSDAKNWLKMPTSKHYTADYKSSPLIYWKSPTRRLDYLTKIRKIRDYQRMLNYFDKMINEKVGSNQRKDFEYTETKVESSQRKDFEYTETPLVAETVPIKIDKIKQTEPKKYILDPYKNLKNDDHDRMVSCKCPKKLGQLLSKLIVNIQDMIPHMISNKLGIHKCVNESKSNSTMAQFTTSRAVKQTKQRMSEFPTTIQTGSLQKSIRKFTEKLTTLPPKLTKKSTTTRTFTSTTTSTTAGTTASAIASGIASTARSITASIANTDSSIEVTDFEKEFFENNLQPSNIATTFVPNYQMYERNNFDYDSIFKPTVAPYIETISNIDTKSTPAEIFLPIKMIDSSNEATSTEKVIVPYTVEPSYSRATVPLYREEEYDDYFVSTTKNTNDFDKLDIQNLELVKTKMLSTQNEFKPQNKFKKMTINSKPLNYHPVIKQKDLDLSSMRKMADMIYLPQEKNAKEMTLKSKSIPRISMQSYKNQVAPKLRSMTTNAKITNSVESNTSITSTKITSSLKNSIKITSSEPDSKTEPMDTKLSLDQVSSDNIGEEEFQDEYGFKQIESSSPVPYKYKNSTREKKQDTEQEKEETPSPWEVLKNEEKIISTYSKSMLPPMRPIYLEIQRNNDWRQDDHPDYDINFNNNIFDLPNI